ncbi:hypothetical protein LAZ67_21001323 [Cordylochernes scorpioides]|uniref:PiggyBac transposable element-derived protein domain-containing protein n=1 Tax=Cordylochernes scorpioides TaxID=51811 RepID=A0ABY6LPG6_9ARAC|nr:hypothetical protein LAZ67_21001323 [Cordylochernes scorpioides]
MKWVVKARIAGKCNFRQYIPSKPARYSLKMYLLCDARTFYTVNIKSYVVNNLGPFYKSNTPDDVVETKYYHFFYPTGIDLSALLFLASMKLQLLYHMSPRNKKIRYPVVNNALNKNN